MARKQIITNTEIEKDIIGALNNPPNSSRDTYRRGRIIAIAIVILLTVIGLIYPMFILWFFLGILVFLMVGFIAYPLYRKNRIKRVAIKDYDITVETVESTAEEHYKIKGSIKIKGRKIDNYYVFFENGKEWRIPKVLYSWGDTLRRVDFSIYGETHRGDAFIVVTKRSTGKIVVAYNTEIFEYKN